MKRLTVLCMLLLITAAYAQDSGPQSPVKTMWGAFDGNYYSVRSREFMQPGDYTYARGVDPHTLPLVQGIEGCGSTVEYYGTGSPVNQCDFGGTDAVRILNCIDYHDANMSRTYHDLFIAAAVADSDEIALFYGENGTWTRLSCTANSFDTTTKWVSIVPYKRIIYVMGANGLKYADPETMEVKVEANFPVAADDCRFMAVYNERLFVGGSIDYPSTIWHCAAGKTTDWSTPEDAGNFDLPDGSRTTGMFTFKDALWIFSNESVWQLTGTGPGEFYTRNVMSGIGGQWQAAIAASNDWMYFVGTDGHYYRASGGASIERLSNNFYDDIRINSISGAPNIIQTPGVFYDNKWIVCKYQEESYNVYAAQYSEISGKWTQYESTIVLAGNAAYHDGISTTCMLAFNENEDVDGNNNMRWGLYYNTAASAPGTMCLLEGNVASKEYSSYTIYTPNIAGNPGTNKRVRRVGAYAQFMFDAASYDGDIGIRVAVNRGQDASPTYKGSEHDEMAYILANHQVLLEPPDDNSRGGQYWGGVKFLVEPYYIEEPDYGITYISSYPLKSKNDFCLRITGRYSRMIKYYIEYYEEPYPREQ